MKWRGRVCLNPFTEEIVDVAAHELYQLMPQESWDMIVSLHQGDSFCDRRFIYVEVDSDEL